MIIFKIIFNFISKNMQINKIIYFFYIFYLYFQGCINAYNVDKDKNLIDKNFNVKFNWINDFFISTIIFID